MTRILCLITACFLVLAAGCFPQRVFADSRAAEYRLKAVFLLNFARFAQWPKDAFAGEKAELVIGVLGRDPFGDALKELEGKMVNGRQVRVAYLTAPFEPRPCQLVFIAGNEAPHLEKYLGLFEGNPALLVSDIPRFGERGGHIELFTRHNKVRFRINLAAVESSHIVLSSKLLRLAELVGSP